MNVIAFLIIVFAAACFTGFFWMIGLGILADIFNAPNLAISYWQSVLVGLVANLLLGIGSSND